MKNQHIISSSDKEGGTKQQGRYKKSQRNRAEAKVEDTGVGEGKFVVRKQMANDSSGKESRQTIGIPKDMVRQNNLR